MCRHDGCGKRFTLSRYGNRTYTSERTRRGRHLFCSSRCRKAHKRAAAFMQSLLTDSNVALDPGARRLIASMISAVENDFR